MILFLTSSPSGPLNQPNDEHLLDFKNGFVGELKKVWKKEMKGLMIAAFPYQKDSNMEMTSFFHDAFNNSGLPISFDLCDGYCFDQKIEDYDFIMLAGGHIPTQNQFFKDIHLKERLKNFNGIVMGVSAGTMNSASIVYVQPELPGESNPSFERFIEGLALTTIQVCPHYQMVKDYYLDGKRLFEDITYEDSKDSSFIALNDGSYIVVKEDQAWLYGEAYLIKNKEINQICKDNEITLLELS